MGAKRHKELGGLTVKERRFVDLYVFGSSEFSGNASACYRHVYETDAKDEVVWVEACNLLKKPAVKETLRDLMDTLTQPAIIKKGILAETTAEHSRDRTKAWELLGKTHAMFVDKQEVDVKINEIALSDEDFDDEKGSKA